MNYGTVISGDIKASVYKHLSIYSAWIYIRSRITVPAIHVIEPIETEYCNMMTLCLDLDSVRKFQVKFFHFSGKIRILKDTPVRFKESSTLI